MIFLDARGQNDKGYAAIVEGFKKKARTISKVRPIFADNPMDRLCAEFVIEQQIKLPRPPSKKVRRLNAFGQIDRAFDFSIAFKQFLVTPVERLPKMPTVRDNRTGGLIAAILPGGSRQRPVPVADNQEPVRAVGVNLLQFVTPSHAVFRRSGMNFYCEVPDSRDWDSTFFRIFPGLNMTLRRAGTYTVSPVLGLRAWFFSFVSLTSQEPNPRISIRLPLQMEDVMASKRTSTASKALVLGWPMLSERYRAREAFVIVAIPYP